MLCFGGYNPGDSSVTERKSQMLVPTPTTGSESSPRSQFARPGRRFLTNPAHDPLGLAAELYYARTGHLDYDDVLGAHPDPEHPDFNGQHPFEACYVAQGRYNVRVQYVRDAVTAEGGDPGPFRFCRDRWHCNRGSDTGARKTSACMALCCPGCWITRVERALQALEVTKAPVLGVISTDWMGMGRDLREVLTERSRQALVCPQHLNAADRIHTWHPLFWGLFAMPGAELPGYRFAGIFVAGQPLNRRPSYGVDAETVTQFGIPRVLEAHRVGESAPVAVTSWERSFSGESRYDDAWQAFRTVTGGPVMTSSEDGSSPGDTDGDMIRAEGEALTWTQVQRTYARNQTRFAAVDTPSTGLQELRLLDVPGVYADARGAHKVFLKRIEAFRAGKA